MKIIVAEDDGISRTRLTAVLKTLGHEPLVFQNGAAAWEAFQEERCRVVISDWEMPEMDGIELCRKIRSQEGAEYTYFILVTAAHTGDDAYTRAIEADVDDFLAKPLRRDALWRRLRVAQRILSFTHKIQQLEKLLPVCMYCKKVRDDGDYWQEMETYLRAQTGSDLIHGVCPTCVEHVIKEWGLESPKTN